MAAMSAPERAQFLSRVLGYDRIRAAQERLKEKRSALRARLDALRASLGDPAELEAGETARPRAPGGGGGGGDRRRRRSGPGSSAGSPSCVPGPSASSQLREARHAARGRDPGRGSRGRLRGARGSVELAAAGRPRPRTAGAGCVEVAAPAGAPAGPARRGRGARRPGRGARPPAGARRAARRRAQAPRRRWRSGSRRLPAAPVIETARLRAQELRASLTVVALDAENARTAWVRDAQDARTKRQGLLDHYQESARSAAAAGEGRTRRATVPPAPGRSAPSTRTCSACSTARWRRSSPTGTTTSSGSSSSRTSRRSSTELDRRRVELERELSGAPLPSSAASRRSSRRPAPLGRGAEAPPGSGRRARGRDRQPSRRPTTSAGTGRSRAGIRALEPLALEAERLRVVGERAAGAPRRAGRGHARAHRRDGGGHRAADAG